MSIEDLISSLDRFMQFSLRELYVCRLLSLVGISDYEMTTMSKGNTIRRHFTTYELFEALNAPRTMRIEAAKYILKWANISISVDWDQYS